MQIFVLEARHFFIVFLFLMIKKETGGLSMKLALGSNVASRRHALHMTQATLAEKADISINFLSKLERNHSTQVSSETLYSLAKALGTSMDSLIEGKFNQASLQQGPNRIEINAILDQLDLQSQEEICQAILRLLKTDLPDKH